MMRLRKLQKAVAGVVLLMVFGALSACGAAGPGLSGLAGDSTTVPATEAETVAATPPDAPTSTATAIPGTYGHIVYVSDRDGQMNLYLTTPDGVGNNRSSHQHNSTGRTRRHQGKQPSTRISWDKQGHTGPRAPLLY